jgi:hypothetical protein
MLSFQDGFLHPSGSLLCLTVSPPDADVFMRIVDIFARIMGLAFERLRDDDMSDRLMGYTSFGAALTCDMDTYEIL